MENKSPQYRYFAMTSSGQVLTADDTGYAKSLNMRKSGEILMLKLKNGELFHLMPGDTDQFLAICRSYVGN